MKAIAGCLFLLLVFCTPTNAQDISLRKKIRQAQEQLDAGNTDSALVLANDLISYSNLFGNEETKAEGNLIKAEVFTMRKDSKGALKTYLQAYAGFEKAARFTKVGETFLRIAELYESLEVPERTIEYLLRSLPLLSEGQSEKRFEIKLKLAICYQRLANYGQSVKLFEECLPYFEGQHEHRFVKFIYSRLSEIYKDQNQLPQALSVNQKLIKLETESKNESNLTLAYNNVGYLYKTMGDFKNAEIAFETALMREAQNARPEDKTLINLYINLASLSNTNKNYIKALGRLRSAYELAEKANNKTQEADIMNFISLTFFNANDYQNAYINAKKAIDISEKLKNKEVLVRAYKTFSQILEKLGDYEEAYQYHVKYANLRDSVFYIEKLEAQEQLQKRLNVERMEKELKILLSDAEKSEIELQKLSLESDKKQKDLELLKSEKAIQEFAFKTEALEKERLLQQSKLQSQQLENEKKNQMMAFLKTTSELEAARLKQKLDGTEKESKIKLLERNKTILENTKKLQQSQLEVQYARQNYFIVFISLVVFMSAFLLIGIINIKRKNNKIEAQRNEILESQSNLQSLNELIVQKNKNITDSIRYAKNIQSALLPAGPFWRSIFPQSFVFYQPKDIVSGDFYFLTQFQGKLFLAVADCTGHGVPGAFMSLIGHNLLTNIIEVQGETNPGKILNQLNKHTRALLRQNETATRDGMDIAICAIDKENKVMEFAAAMMSLYYINHDGELNEVKGHRFSIGDLDALSESQKETHRLSFEKPITIYLSSDGYHHQFGGPNGRKFMLNQYKELLINIASKPFPEQKQLVENTMQNWMQNERQLDDMVVVGIKLS